MEHRPELQTGSDSCMRMLASWSVVCCGIVLGSDLRIYSAVCLLSLIFAFCKTPQWTWYTGR